MIVRIRLHHGGWPRRARLVVRKLAESTAALLIPLTLMASLLSVWRLAADLSLASHFAIQEGPFSRWQAWAAVATALGLTSGLLSRYARRGRLSASADRQSSAAGGDIP
jgi:hypothetical protein